MGGRATREAYGEAILELGKLNADIYVVDADIGKPCMTIPFSEQLPQQHVNVGIAEQNAAGVAAGLATTGKIPFVTTYAVFGSMRMCEQIRQVICYPKLNVKIACSHGGLTPGTDGASHQGSEDMGVLRSLPNMTIVMPADFYSAKALVKAAAGLYGPVYLRFTKNSIPFIYDESVELTIGKANLLKDGNDIALIANGDIMSLAISAADQLEKQNYSVRLLDMHTIKPIDSDAVNRAIDDIGKIVTIEDHNILNGLGSAVCEIVAERGKGIVKRIGIQDQFGESASYEYLLAKNGITVDKIVASAKKLMAG